MMATANKVLRNIDAIKYESWLRPTLSKLFSYNAKTGQSIRNWEFQDNLLGCVVWFSTLGPPDLEIIILHSNQIQHTVWIQRHCSTIDAEVTQTTRARWSRSWSSSCTLWCRWKLLRELLKQCLDLGLLGSSLRKPVADNIRKDWMAILKGQDLKGWTCCWTRLFTRPGLGWRHGARVPEVPHFGANAGLQILECGRFSRILRFDKAQIPKRGPGILHANLSHGSAKLSEPVVRG